MSGTATPPGDVDAAKTLDDLARVARWHEALAARTGGLTWMLWGLVAAAIFVTYSYLGVLASSHAPEAARFYPVAWAPWLALGLVMTRALWRSAGLVIPVEPRDLRRTDLVASGTFLALTLLALWGTRAAGIPVLEPAAVLAALGVATSLLGAFGVIAPGPFEKRLAVTGGALLVVVAAGATLAFANDPIAGYAWLSLIAPASVLLVLFGGGALVYART